MMSWNYFWWPQEFYGLVYAFPQPEYPETVIIPAPQQSRRPAQQNNSKHLEAQSALFFQELEKLLKEKYRRPQKKTWSVDEDKKLIDLANEGVSFENITSHFPNSNAESCYRRYERLTKMSRKWPEQLNNEIKMLVEEKGLNWVEVSHHIKENSRQFHGYSPKMIRERYNNYLKEGLERKVWTIEEDLYLVRLVRENKINWSQLPDNFPGRSQLEIKNRYYGVLGPVLSRALKRAKTALKKRRIFEAI